MFVKRTKKVNEKCNILKDLIICNARTIVNKSKLAYRNDLQCIEIQYKDLELLYNSDSRFKGYNIAVLQHIIKLVEKSMTTLGTPVDVFDNTYKQHIRIMFPDHNKNLFNDKLNELL